MSVLVIGNGESRQCLDLKKISKQIITVGCNAVYRDVDVDHLICCDQKMAQESRLNTKDQNTKIYTRKKWLETNLRSLGEFYPLPDIPFEVNNRSDEEMNWGSGPYGVLLGSSLSDTVIMIGFDLYGNNNFINNVYKGTKNYLKTDSQAVDPSYWIYQISKIFQRFQNKSFIILNDKDWKLPQEWIYDNVRLKEYNFLREFVAL